MCQKRRFTKDKVRTQGKEEQGLTELAKQYAQSPNSWRDMISNRLASPTGRTGRILPRGVSGGDPPAGSGLAASATTTPGRGIASRMTGPLAGEGLGAGAAGPRRILFNWYWPASSAGLFFFSACRAAAAASNARRAATSTLGGIAEKKKKKGRRGESGCQLSEKKKQEWTTGLTEFTW